MASQNLSQAILKNIRLPSTLPTPSPQDSRNVAPFFATSSFVGNRMNMIPSPAQAMTILRALNLVDLKSYPIEVLEILLPLLKELLNGQIALYKSIPDDVFVRLNNVVHDVLEKSQLRQQALGQSRVKVVQETPDIQVDQTHVMQVLRAINAIPSHNIDTVASKRMKTVKSVLLALHRSNQEPIRQLLKSQSSEDKICVNIIKNALRLVHDESQ